MVFTSLDFRILRLVRGFWKGAVGCGSAPPTSEEMGAGYYSKKNFFKYPLWINLKGIPMELLKNEGISHIASGVGIPLFLDKATELRKRLSFACV